MPPGKYTATMEKVELQSDEKLTVTVSLEGKPFTFEVNAMDTERTLESGIDPRLSEAVHYLQEWSSGIGKRWKKFREAATRAGFSTLPALALTVDKVDVKILDGEMNTRPSVCVVVDGDNVDISKAVQAFSFDQRILLKLNEAVLSTLTAMEKALQDKLDVVGKLPDLYGPDALDLKLEMEEKKTGRAGL